MSTGGRDGGAATMRREAPGARPPRRRRADAPGTSQADVRGAVMGALKTLIAAAAGASVIAAALIGSTVQPRTAATPGTVHFTASGDIGARAESAAVLSQVDALDPDLHLALGDLSYGATGAEQTWCDFVTTRVGAGFPFELISGNHES